MMTTAERMRILREIERAFNDSRMEQRRHGHDWDVADAMAAVSGVLTQDLLDEGGLPIHMPMGVDQFNQGPVEPEKPHHRVCWCADRNCKWTVALEKERARV